MTDEERVTIARAWAPQIWRDFCVAGGEWRIELLFELLQLLYPTDDIWYTDEGQTWLEQELPGFLDFDARRLKERTDGALAALRYADRFGARSKPPTSLSS